jgi:hypothetical protein
MMMQNVAWCYGLLQTDAEAMAAEEYTVMHRPRRLRALYPC